MSRPLGCMKLLKSYNIAMIIITLNIHPSSAKHHQKQSGIALNALGSGAQSQWPGASMKMCNFSTFCGLCTSNQTFDITKN